MRSILSQMVAISIVFFARLVTAVRGIWYGIEPVDIQRVYFSNHTSNGDFVLIWTVLPPKLRRKTRPVAGLDYWLGTPLKSFIGKEVFNAVLIDRNRETRKEDPVELICGALDEGSSLIIFPEGTRNMGDEPILPFKTGLFHLAEARPDIDLVPVWISNLTRVMPKGEIIPVPLICTVTFGSPMRIKKNEDKPAFLTRAEQALVGTSNIEKRNDNVE